eukprot:15360734-Heterocapsa_arctica.AAC.1
MASRPAQGLEALALQTSLSAARMSWSSERLRFLGVLGCGIGSRGSGPARGRSRPSRPRGLLESVR